VTDRLSTGKKLWSTRARFKPSNLSCVNFETYVLGSLIKRVQTLYKHR
jgi:hypothetical protein